MDRDAQPTLVTVLRERARATPGHVCLSFEGARHTYADVHARSAAFAGALRAWGLGRGDRVALFLENSPEFLFAYLGTLMAGGTVVLVNTQYKQTELRHILGDSGARLCVTDAPQSAELARVRDDVPALEAVVALGADLDRFVAEGAGTIMQVDDGRPSPDDPAVIGYTSGTTGRSKGAVLLHRNLAANARAIVEAWRWLSDDRLLIALPLFHVHGLLVGFSGTLTAGAGCELHRRFDAQAVLGRLASGELTMFFGVPTMYARLIDALEARGAADAALRRMRLFVSGSAALSPQLFEAFERLTGHRILERYGMTETIMNLTNPYEGERRPGTVGQPFPGQEARVVDVRTRAPLPAEAIGEIEVRGPHVFAGYLNRPDATGESFSGDGWFRTGDLGKVSADGYFTITGRARELIITGGYNVYPREVEEVLARCPGVVEVAVFGRPDREFGEIVCAAIVPRGDLTPEAVVAFCRDQLASYKKPRSIVLVDALPRNAMGKVQKHVLAEQTAVTDPSPPGGSHPAPAAR